MTIEITFLNQNVSGPSDRAGPADESSQFPRRQNNGTLFIHPGYFHLSFRVKIAASACHLACNLSVILVVLFVSVRQKEQFAGLYGEPVASTGPVRSALRSDRVINRVVVPQFLDGFFMDVDVRIFGEFPAFFLRGRHGNACPDAFFLRLLSDHSPDRLSRIKVLTPAGRVATSARSFGSAFLPSSGLFRTARYSGLWVPSDRRRH